MSLKDEVGLMKKEFDEKREKHSINVRNHVGKYGASSCDYLDHQRNMVNYFTGKYNALIELENRCPDIK